jgi:hypothetical protein
MFSDFDARLADNLQRWQQSGAPLRWVEARQGRWNHADWLDLLAELESSESWPLAPDAVGRVLEETRARWHNLQRWRQSGAAWAWLDAREGRWDRHDWLALLWTLRVSDFWPLDPEALARLLEEIRGQWWALRRWQESGEPLRWVEAHQGHWTHADWLALLAKLQRSERGAIDPDRIGVLLEDLKRKWWNLRRWRDSGQPHLWVQAHGGRWNHDDWTALLLSLRESAFWPLDPDGVAAVVAEARARHDNLRRWRESGGAREWVEARKGRWGHADWLSLLGALEREEFWPLEAGALAELLEGQKRKWWNLHRWRTSGLARRWVEERRGDWREDDWRALLGALERSEFGPVDPVALRRVLEEHQARWWNLRRWKKSGHPERWVEGHRGRWTARDWRWLVESLERSQFWPLDLDLVRQVIEAATPPARQAA